MVAPSLQPPRRHSLKTRVSLLMLAALVFCIGSLAVYAEHVLRQDMQQLLGAQQYSVARQMALQVQSGLQERQDALQKIAQVLGPHMDAPRRLQQQLGTLPVFQSLFNGGTFVVTPEGTAIASLPLSAERAGINYLDRDYIAQALRANRTGIGTPVIGRRLNTPVLAMATPIHDSQGRVIGALAGITQLSESNFLDRMRLNHYGDSGYYLLVDASHRLIVTASDPRRTMEVLPAPGASPSLDRFIDGYQGHDVFVSPMGQEVLAAAARIADTGWYVAVVVPTQEAFAPIRTMRLHLFYAALTVTLLSLLATWWLLGRQLAPLQSMARQLRQNADDPQHPHRLPVQGPHEIGQVATSFNQLLDELGQHQQRMQASETLYRTAFQTTPDSLSITRTSDGTFIEVNEGFTRLYGWRREDTHGKTSAELGIWRHWQDRQQLIDTLARQSHCENLEAEHVRKDGSTLPALVSATAIEIDGVACMLSITRDISAQKEAMARIHQLAYSDPLTGLPNRRLLMDRLQQAIRASLRHGRYGALVYVDLDDFKTLNDTQGHDRGDQLLQLVAQRLQQLVKPDETVARLASDEFVVVLEDIADNREAAATRTEALARAIQAALQEPALLGQGQGQQVHHCSACIGITLFGRVDEKPTEPLMRADLAMYQAKNAGRNCLRFFDPEIQALVNHRAHIESALRRALQQGAFELHYQIQTREDGCATGAEALVRWTDADGHSIPPAQFIPVAEDTGLILPLGRWILETACQSLARWQQDSALSHLSLSVNISARQLHQDDFVDMVQGVLQRTGAPAQRLKLELTESMLVRQPEAAIAKMHALQALGVGFSIDDFGTGFSSLAYLKRLPLDQIKIDQSFVRDILVNPNDLAIAQMVIALGHSLKLTVVAEGVETQAQRDLLASLGCHHYQGYLIGAPMALAQAEAELRQRCPSAA